MKMLTVFVCAMMAMSRSADAVSWSEIPPTTGIPPTTEDHMSGWSPSCPDGWTMFNIRCLLYVPNKMTWVEAERNCQSKSWAVQGNLASVLDSQSSDEIKKMMQSAGHKNGQIWVGGCDTMDPSWDKMLLGWSSDDREHVCLQKKGACGALSYPVAERVEGGHGSSSLRTVCFGGVGRRRERGGGDRLKRRLINTGGGPIRTETQPTFDRIRGEHFSPEETDLKEVQSRQKTIYGDGDDPDAEVRRAWEEVAAAVNSAHCGPVRSPIRCRRRSSDVKRLGKRKMKRSEDRQAGTSLSASQTSTQEADHAAPVLTPDNRQAAGGPEDGCKVRGHMVADERFNVAEDKSRPIYLQ